MKNILSAITTLILLGFQAQSQITATSGGPDSYGYSFLTSANMSGPAYSWVDITSTGTNITAGLADDNYVGPFNIGFDFPFYWTTANSFYIGSNGYISFETPHTISSDPADPAFSPMPTSGGADNFIAPLLSDLNFSGVGNPGQVYYQSNGINELIISFISVPFWDGSSPNDWSGNNTFQIILDASDSTITLNYQTQSGSWNSGYDGNSGASVIGIESLGSLAGLTVGSSELPLGNFSIEFGLNVSSAFSLTDLAANWNDNSKNGGFFVSQQQPKAIATNISNNGTNDVTTSFNVSTIIKEAGVNTATTFNSSVASLLAGQNQTINYSPSLLLQNFNCGGTCDAGTYTVETSIGYSDDNALNNDKSSEMVVLDESNLSSVNYSYTDNISEDNFGFEAGAVYMKPVTYPLDLIALEFDLITDGSAPTAGYTAKVFDDTGANGTPGSLVYSQYVAPGSISYNTGTGTGNYELHTLSLPLTINSGGIYIVFELEDENANLNIAIDATPPCSNQNYEVLSGTFGEYRSNDQADLMINAIFDISNACSQNYTASDQICNNDTIVFGSQTITSAGVFIETFTNSTCVSVVYITVSTISNSSSSIRGKF